MTIAVAVRTDSAVVFATDSKLTARGIAGLDPDGNPNWVDQTYENATKVVHDRTRHLMAMAAGSANLGQMPVGDFIASEAFPRCETAADEDAAIVELLERMTAHKRAFWSQTQIEPADWPGPQLVMATASSERRRPRLWKASLQGDRYEHDEVLTEPGVLLDGTYEQVFSLLYGYTGAFALALGRALAADAQQVAAAMADLKLLRPIDKLNLWTMPLQDAIDLAVFLAHTQIEMDRFLPGLPACGGPIDVMVLRVVPDPEILSYPGKLLHHPHQRGRI